MGSRGPKKNPLSEEEQAMLALPNAAELFGVTPSRISQLRREYNVPLPPRPQQGKYKELSEEKRGILSLPNAHQILQVSRERIRQLRERHLIPAPHGNAKGRRKGAHSGEEEAQDSE